MKIPKFIVIATVLLLASQVFAQGALTPVERLAAIAESTGHAQPVMPTVPPRHVRSFLWVVGGFKPGLPPTKPVNCNKNGFCPPSVAVAYGDPNVIGGNGGAGVTIAITDAFHYANNEADLNFFSTDMGLPACTHANGCFLNVDQNGGTNFCGSDKGWETETMLDIEWAHAMAPNAKIVLVEGCTNDDSDLAAAVQTAVKLEGANFVSNSWGEDEFPEEIQEDADWVGLGVPLMFASGDSGAPAIYPCQSPYATCIGGTQLTLDANFHRTNETGWAGSGGGCSVYEPSQTFQTSNGVTLCGSNRAAPDVAAVASTASPVYIYDSGNGGYGRVGGTSVATPVAAGVFANVEAARRSFHKADFPQIINNQLYHPYKSFGTPASNYTYFYWDVLTGSNGHAAGPGYDLVTGLGVSYPVNMANPFFGLQ
jgi:subtilase family serine protease